MYRHYIKPAIDYVGSTLIFLVSSPIFLIITITLSIANKGKPFYLQKRPGKNEKIFKIIKFKTMTDGKDQNGNILPDDKRLTNMGSFVRKTSLDEIPQLLNVMKGDMSLIGPRPLAIQYLPLYSPNQSKRHSIKPGITGWAQVNGRNNISWKKKFELDTYYVEKISFFLDLKILYRTVYKVFKREGVEESGQAKVESFNGNN